jgi:hypothetical protein
MLRIGVTGHRHLVGVPAIRAGVRAAFRVIEKHYPSAPWRLVSPLAEGADRIVAAEALRRPQTELVVPLPLPIEDYLLDFPTKRSRDRFARLLRRAQRIIELPMSASREEAYQAVGRYVAQESDLLIAIWDGQPARGHGGTAEVVAAARQRGIPVAWVCTAAGQNGDVVLERFAAHP